MKAAVVDTNVLVTANGGQPAADGWCTLACVEALLDLQKDGVVVLDDAHRILREYGAYCSHAGQPGVGDWFFSWLHQNQAVVERVERVTVTETTPDDFAEIPADPALSNLDRNDRKFVAVACASSFNPPILFSIERGWWRHESALAANGVVVKSLCPQYRPEIARLAAGVPEQGPAQKEPL